MQANDKRKNSKLFALYTSLSFLLLLILFSLGSIIKKDQTFSNAENRTLVSFPTFSVNRLLNGEFESDLENYLNDQFLGRNFFVQTKTKTDVALGKKESQGVVLGKDGQLMEEFQPVPSKDLEQKMANIQNFLTTNDKLHSYFLIAPTAININKDKAPSGMKLTDQNLYLDDFFSKVSANGGIPIDVRESFRSQTDKQLYYNTDHHWTTYGAYQAFQVAADTMGLNASKVQYNVESVTNNFQGSLTYKSGFEMSERDSIEVYLPDKGGVHSVVNYVQEKKKTATLYNHEKLKTRDGYGMFLDGNHSLVKIQSPIKGKKVLLMLKDSYANSFIPFLTAYFSEIVVVDPRYYYDDLQELIKSEAVTDVLFLYNANTFFPDTTLNNVLG